jgi:hypothetical protein
LDKASADFDVRHRFTFASVWDLPFGRGRTYLNGISRGVDLLVGGWQVNTDITIQSGPPYTVFSGGVRADLIGDPTPTADQRARGLELNPAAFRPARTLVFAGDAPCTATDTSRCYGSLGRNVFRGARQEFVNASLFKNLHVTEGFNIQFRAQAYNLFNHVNGFRPVNDLSSNVFGTDTAEQRRRQLEFGMRLIF